MLHSSVRRQYWTAYDGCESTSHALSDGGQKRMRCLISPWISRDYSFFSGGGFCRSLQTHLGQKLNGLLALLYFVDSNFRATVVVVIFILFSVNPVRSQDSFPLEPEILICDWKYRAGVDPVSCSVVLDPMPTEDHFQYPADSDQVVISGDDGLGAAVVLPKTKVPGSFIMFLSHP